MLVHSELFKKKYTLHNKSVFHYYFYAACAVCITQ